MEFGARLSPRMEIRWSKIMKSFEFRFRIQVVTVTGQGHGRGYKSLREMPRRRIMPFNVVRLTPRRVAAP